MATLNRFPLFGLWNRVAAGLLDYTDDEAMCIGHGVAVLYAIRAQGGGHRKSKTKAEKAKAIPAGDSHEAMATQDVRFGGDSLPCEFDADGHVLKCLVGVQSPKDAVQTPDSYLGAVEEKIPAEYLDRLATAMNQLLATYEQRELHGGLIYGIYDEWKQRCKAGRRVDLDQLVTWLEKQTKTRRAA